MNRKEFFLLGIIVILSFVFSFYKLGNLPKAFFTDEMALGYNAWSLQTTFRDEYGKFLPLTLRSFDDYKPALYSYFTVPVVGIFGLNQFSSRLVAGIAGFLLPVVLFLLVKKITKKNGLALISALIVVITPWHWETSRTAIEAGVALSLGLGAFVLFLQKRDRHRLLGFCLVLLTLFTYHTARLLVPAFLVLGIFFKIFKFNRKWLGLSVLIVFFGIGLALSGSSARFSQISIFTDKEARLLREEAIREDGGAIKVPLLMTRILHNKAWSAGESFTKSYLTNTSLYYLFLGGAQPPRVTIPETGQFLVVLLPFFLLGLGVSVRSWKKFDKWLLAWLLVAPLPTSLTTAEIPHTYRTLFLLPVISIYIGMGLIFVFNFFKKYNTKLANFVVLIIGVALVISTTKAWHQYSVHSQVHQPWHRQYGYYDLVNFINTLENKEKIVVTNRENEPYMAFLFYNKIKPKRYQANPEKRLGHVDIDGGAKIWQMFEYTFSEEKCPHDLQDKNPNNYYVAYFTCELPEGFERIKIINFLDGNPEFFVDRPLVVKIN